MSYDEKVIGFKEIKRGVHNCVALVAGIGFTMCLFIVGSAFNELGILSNARLSAVVGSLLSALCGVAVLRLASHR